ncbi:MAG TPA: hypothetical protein VNH65_05960 [Candidatus Acidoferrum sp.]|nr:hypothetical protein [Candidatus Acidoferrum sp.]
MRAIAPWQVAPLIDKVLNILIKGGHSAKRDDLMVFEFFTLTKKCGYGVVPGHQWLSDKPEIANLQRPDNAFAESAVSTLIVS